MEQLSDKDEILTEVSKTVTRLKNKGKDLTGLYYGINEKLRNPKVTSISDKIKGNESEDTNSEQIPEGHVIWKPEDDFVKLYPDALSKIAFRLSGAEAITLIKLIPFIDYQSGMLKKDKKPLITKDIIDITKYSKVTVIDIMEKLVNERILSKNRVGRTYEYFVNPYIFFKGKYINHTLLDMFKDYRKTSSKSSDESM